MAEFQPVTPTDLIQGNSPEQDNYSPTPGATPAQEFNPAAQNPDAYQPNGKSWVNLFNSSIDANPASSIIKPLGYDTEAAKRYPQFNVLQDNEEIYAQTQSTLGKLGNSLVKFGGTALGTFAEGLMSIPDVARSLTGGNAYKNEWAQSIDNWTHNLENSFPNYYTNWEKEHPLQSMIPFRGLFGNGGFTNFIGDKVIKNLGFTVGAIASAVVTDLAVGAVTGGIGEIPLIGAQVGKAALWLNKIFSTSKADDLARIIFQAKAVGASDETIMSLTQMARMAQAGKIGSSAKYLTTLYGASNAEAGIEARQGYNDVKETLIQDYISKNGSAPTGVELENIEKIATESGNTRYGMNMALLMVSNAIQFEHILKPLGAFKRGVATDVAGKVENQAGKFVIGGSKPTTAEAINDVTLEVSKRTGVLGMLDKVGGAIKPVVPAILSEGIFEEGGQFAIEKGTKDYYENKYLSKKYDGEAKDGLDDILHSTWVGLKEEFGSTEGWENIILGSITGAMTHPVESLFRNRKEEKLGILNKSDATNASLATLNSVGVTGIFDQNYDNAAEALRINKDLEKAIANNDVFKFKNLQTEAFFNFIMSGIHSGRFDVREEQLNMLKELPEEELNKLFGLEEGDRANTSLYVDKLIDKAKQIEASHKAISNLFQNPFTYRGGLNSEEAINQSKAYLAFEGYKEALVKFNYQVGDFNTRQNEILSDVTAIHPSISEDFLRKVSTRQGYDELHTEYEKQIADQQKILDTKDLTAKEYLDARKKKIALETNARLIQDTLSETNPSPEATLHLANNIINFEINGRIFDNKATLPLDKVIEVFTKGADYERIKVEKEETRKNYDFLVTRAGQEQMLRHFEKWKEHLNLSPYQKTPGSKPFEIDPDKLISTPHGDFEIGRTYAHPDISSVGKWKVVGRKLISPLGERVFVSSKSKKTPEEVAAFENENIVNNLASVVIVGRSGNNIQVRDAQGNVQTVHSSFLKDFEVVLTEEERLAADKESSERIKTLQEQINEFTSNVPVLPTDPAEAAKLVVHNAKQKTTIEALSSSVTAKVTTEGTTEYDSQASIAHHRSIREAHLLQNALENSEIRESLRVIPVTFNNQQSLGFNFIQPTYTRKAVDGSEVTIDNKLDAVNGAIALIYVREKDGVWYTVDEQGEFLAPINKDSKQDPNKFNYTFQENASADRTVFGKKGKLKAYDWLDYTPEQQDQLLEAAKESRKANFLATNPLALARTFSISSGTGNYERNKDGSLNFDKRNSVISIGLIDEDTLDEEQVVEVPTIQSANAPKGFGVVKSRNGIEFHVQLGAPMLRTANSVHYLNNRKLTPAETENIFNILKYIAFENLNGRGIPKNVVEFLSNVVYLNNKTSGSSFFFDSANNSVVLGNTTVLLTPEAIENNKAEILASLSGLYHNTNKKSLNSESFYEIIGIKDNKPEFRIWKSYQHYLVSDKYELTTQGGENGQPRTNIPLTTNIRPSKEYRKSGFNELPIMNRYISMDDYFINPIGLINFKPKGSQAPTGSTPQTGVAYNNKPGYSYTLETPQGKVTIDGKTLNSFTLANGEEVQYFVEILDDGNIVEVLDIPEDQAGNLTQDEIEAIVYEIDDAIYPAYEASKKPTDTTGLTSFFSGGTGLSFYQQLFDLIANNIDSAVRQETQLIAILTPVIKSGKVTSAEDVRNFLNSRVIDKSDEEIEKEAADKVAGLSAEEKAAFDQENYRTIGFNEEVDKVWDEPAFKSFMAENLPQVEVETLKTVITKSGGGFAWGGQRGNYIRIYEGAPEGTEYHEAFEAVWNNFLTEAEQEALIKEFRNRKGTFEDNEIGGLMNFSQATAHQAKEKIADEFGDFVNNGTIFKGEEKKMNFFRRLLNFIEKFIFGDPTTIESIFKKITSAHYRNADISNVAPQTENYSTVREDKVSESWLRDVMYHMTDSIMERVKNPESEWSAPALQEGRIPRSEVYNWVFSDMMNYYEKYVPYMVVNKKMTAKKARMLVYGEGTFKGWNYIKENWEKVVDEHLLFLKSRGLEFQEKYDYQQIEVEEAAMLTDEYLQAQYDNKNQQQYDRDITTVSPLGRASRALRFIFATATEQHYSGASNPSLAPTVSKLSTVGRRILVDSNAEFNKTLNALKGSKNVAEMKERFRRLAITNPNSLPLYNRFFGKATEAQNDDDRKLITQLWTAMGGMSSPLMYMQVINEDGGIYQVDAGAESGKKKIVNSWLTDLKTQDITEADEDGFYIIKTGKIETKMPVGKEATDNAKDKALLKFLEEIHFPLNKQVYDKFDADERETFRALANNLYDLWKGKTQISLERDGGFNQLFNLLADLIVKVGGDPTSGSYQRADGNIGQMSVIPNYPDKVIPVINSSKSKEDLIESLPVYRDIWTANSVLLRDSEWGKKKGRKFQLKNTFVYGQRDAKGDYTDITSAPIGVKFMREFNANVSPNSPVYYTLTPADATIQHAMQSRHYITFSDMKNDWEGAFMPIFKGYLTDEINLIKDYEARKGNAQIAKEGKKLRFFRDIFANRPALLSTIEEAANTGVSTENIIADNEDQIVLAIKDWIADLVTSQYNLLNINNLLHLKIKGSTPDRNRYIWKGLNTDIYAALGKNPTLSEIDIRDIIGFRTLNYVIHNTELHKLFFSDPAQWKDGVKRFKSFLSGREPIRSNDPEYDAAMTATYNKVGDVTLKQNDLGAVEFSNEFTTQTYDNGDSAATRMVSNNIEEIRKAIDSKADKYEVLEEADAQSMASPTWFIQFLERTGSMTPANKAFFAYDFALARQELSQVIDEEGKWGEKGKPIYEYSSEALREADKELIAKPVTSSINSIKPILSGVILNGNMMEAQLFKTSTMLVSYTTAKWAGQNMTDLYIKMFKEKIHYLGGASQHKVGQPVNLPALYNKETGRLNVEGMRTATKINFPWEHMGKQQETQTEHEGQTYMSQLATLYMADMFNAGVPNDFMKGKKQAQREAAWQNASDEKKATSKIKSIADRNRDAQEALIQIGYKEILDSTGIVEENGEFSLEDPTKLVAYLKKSLTKRETADNVLNALGVTYNAALDKYELSTPLEAMNNYSAIKNMLWSLAQKNIVSRKYHGGPHIMVSASMFEGNNRQAVYKKGKKWEAVTDYNKLTPEQKASVRLTSSELKFYTMDKGGKKIKAMEIFMPNHFKQEIKKSPKLKNMTDDELIAYLNSSEEGQSILTGVGARIPTQGANSIDVFIVKRFLPEIMGNAIIVPSEITAKAGSDFDVDKLNTYIKNVYVDVNGDLKLVKLVGDRSEHNRFYADVFLDIRDAKLTIEEERKAKAYGLQSPLMDILLNQGSAKNREYWKKLLTRFFPEAKSGLEIEEILVSRIRNANKRIEELSDDEKQTLALDKFVDDMWKQAHENEYFQSLEDMITLPDNFARMLTPNSIEEMSALEQEISAKKVEAGAGYEVIGAGPAFFVYTEEEAKSVVKDRNKDIPTEENPDPIFEAEAIGEKATYRRIVPVVDTKTSLLHPTQMARLRHINLVMKADGVSISAAANKFYAALQSANVRVLGTMAFPHNKAESINGHSYISLSQKLDGDQQMYVLDKISQAINGAVDASKDPWLARLLGYSDGLPVAMFMIGAGVSLDNVFWFLNQPIIQEYLKTKAVQKTNEVFTGKKASSDNTIAIMVKKAMKIRAKDQYKPKNNEYINLADLKGQVGVRPERINWNYQGYLLDEFMRYKAMAANVRIIQAGTMWDSGYYPSNGAVANKENDYQKALELTQEKYLKPGDPDSLIPPRVLGLETLMQGHNASVRRNLNNTREAYSTIFFADGRGRFMLEQVRDRIMNSYLNPVTKVRMWNQAEQIIINWAISNLVEVGGKPLNSYIRGMFLGNNNIVEQFNKLKKHLASFEEDEQQGIADNPILKKLSVIVQSNKEAPKNIGLVEFLVGAFEQNSFTQAMRELRDNPITNSFYKNLVIAGLLQNGISGGRRSFNQWIPNEDYSPLVKQAVDALNTVDQNTLDVFTSLAVIERVGWRDKNLVPIVREEQQEMSLGMQDMQGYEPGYVPFESDDLSKVTNGKFITLPPELSGDNVVKIVTTNINPETGEEYTWEEKQAFGKNKQYKFLTTRLFKKVIVNGLPVIVDEGSEEAPVEKLLYKQINAWGDSNIQEMYADDRASVIPTNEQINELPDETILNLLKNQEALIENKDVSLTPESILEDYSQTTGEVLGQADSETKYLNNLEAQRELTKELNDLQDTLLEQEEANNLNMESNPYIFIVNNLPKISKESAERETGTKVGIGKDIHHSLISKDGVSVEKAAERIAASMEDEGIKIMDEQDVRNEIISILQEGKQKYIASISPDLKSIKEEITAVEQSLKKVNTEIQTYLASKIKLGDKMEQGTPQSMFSDENGVRGAAINFMKNHKLHDLLFKEEGDKIVIRGGEVYNIDDIDGKLLEETKLYTQEEIGRILQKLCNRK